MTHHVDPNQVGPSPFDKPAAPQLTKRTYGTLRLLTRKVNLESGALYIVDDLGIDPDDPDSVLNRLTDQNGNLKEFRGKQVGPAGRNTHVVVIITTRHKDGHLYNDCRDFMYWDSDKSQRITMPSLQKFFGGPKLPGIYGRDKDGKMKAAEVQAEVVNYIELGKVDPATGEKTEYKRQAYKVVKVFKDQAEREAASTAFYAQFQTDEQTPNDIVDEMLGEDPIPFGDDKDKPVGMSRNDATGVLKSLWAASGKDFGKFLAQVASMPVIVSAVGGIDAQEIQGYNPDTIPL